MDVSYWFGDASGGGFGASWNKNLSDEVDYRWGVWSYSSSKESSNYRELSNLVDTLLEMSLKGVLNGVEVFFFTDNATAEAAFFNGTSSSKLLFEQILKLHDIEMKCSCKIHFIHVSGTRMIAQGTDGLSRGDLNEGVMSGREFKAFIPLHRGALERSPLLLNWLTSWITCHNGLPPESLQPLDWYEKGQDIVGWTEQEGGLDLPILKEGSFIWSPPQGLQTLLFSNYG